MKKIITVLSFLLIISNAYSNNSDALIFLKKSNVEITDTTYECTVVTISSGTYKAAKLSGLSDSSVKILRGESSKEILIKDIKSIKFKGGGFSWTGAAVGAGIAFGFGLWSGNEFGADTYQIGAALLVGFVSAIPLGLIGGGIGALLTEDKFYDLSNLDFIAKRKKVKYIIKEYSDR